ncbi:Hypothetical_protein [Hexamita inflata]|uniref:Hypothetical_protein n=1 Tax=Hexamita inflata TaxID=28002 RepID=A0AA86UKX7_9EUKA|nr:Hypothetical protein HINF_LOCUS49875 [Hexamita inflata]
MDSQLLFKQVHEVIQILNSYNYKYYYDQLVALNARIQNIEEKIDLHKQHQRGVFLSCSGIEQRSQADSQRICEEQQESQQFVVRFNKKKAVCVVSQQSVQIDQNCIKVSQLTDIKFLKNQLTIQTKKNGPLILTGKQSYKMYAQIVQLLK